MVRHRMVAPINSIKHYVPRPNVEIALGTIININIAEAETAPASAAVEDVLEGSVLKAVHVEMWIHGRAATGDQQQFVASLEKRPSDAPAMTFAQSLAMQAYPNKKNILYTTQGVIGDGATQAIPIIREWFKIPKGKQRMGVGDRIVLNISTVEAALAACGLFTYKEYR